MARMFLLASLMLSLSACDVAPAASGIWRGQPGSPDPNAAGLVSLPCDGSTPLEPIQSYYCRKDRHFVRTAVRDALIDVAHLMVDLHPGAKLRFMDASGPLGEKPFSPHLSHGDGRQIDLALYYTDTNGVPLDHFPDTSRHGGFWPAEPARPGEALACPGGRTGPAEKPDPPADRPWRLDEVRTRALVEALVSDSRVKRILIEPHLERRLGLWGHPKLRFAGCQAARHDDHLHVDFH